MMHCDCKCVFPSQKPLMNDHLPIMFTKTLQKCVLLTMTKCATTIFFFNLWMSRFGLDVFDSSSNFWMKNGSFPCYYGLS